MVIYYTVISGTTSRYRAYFGQGTGPILVDDLRCRGDEASIQYCPQNTYGHNCLHNEDAGVECIGKYLEYIG